MSPAGLSDARLARLHDAMAGYVERGEVPGLVAPVGSYGWDGGLGTSWRSDRSEDMITILLTQAPWTSPVPPRVTRDFWAAAYQAIDD